MNRRSLSLAAMLVAGAGCAMAQSASNRDAPLITKEEQALFKGAEGFDDPPPLRMRAVVPAIEVVQPVAANVIKSPFPIVVKFRAADAPIVPTSFRVLYGALKFDITERVAKYVKPTAEGFSFDKAQVPTGKHRLFITIADEKQRVAESELRIEVE